VDNITEIKGEIGRIRNHMDIDKIERIQMMKMLSEISSAIKGNEMTNHKGIVHDLHDLKSQIQTQHDNQTKYEVYFKFFGAALIIFFSGLVTALFKIFVK